MEVSVDLSMEESPWGRHVFSENYVQNRATPSRHRGLVLVVERGSRREARARSGLQIAGWAHAQAVRAARPGGGGELLGHMVWPLPGGTAAPGGSGRRL